MYFELLVSIENAVKMGGKKPNLMAVLYVDMNTLDLVQGVGINLRGEGQTADKSKPINILDDVYLPIWEQKMRTSIIRES